MGDCLVGLGIVGGQRVVDQVPIVGAGVEFCGQVVDVGDTMPELLPVERVPGDGCSGARLLHDIDAESTELVGMLGPDFDVGGLRELLGSPEEAYDGYGGGHDVLLSCDNVSDWS